MHLRYRVSFDVDRSPSNANVVMLSVPALYTMIEPRQPTLEYLEVDEDFESLMLFNGTRALYRLFRGPLSCGMVCTPGLATQCVDNDVLH